MVMRKQDRRGAGGSVRTGRRGRAWAVRMLMALGIVCSGIAAARAQSFQPQGVPPARAHAAAVPEGWKVVRAWAMTAPTDGGFTGQMQLLADTRWTAALDQAMRADPDLCSDDPGSWAKDCEALHKEPMRMAHLRLIAPDGRVLDDLSMEGPGVGVEPLNLYGTPRRTYQLQVDESIGMGSYNGMVTLFVEVRGGHLQWLQARQGMDDAPKRLRFMSSLKTSWKLVPAAGGRGPEFFLVACRPDLSAAKVGQRGVGADGSDDDFVVIYERYFLGDDQPGNGRTVGNAAAAPVWRVKSRSVKGYWESESPFPARSAFP
jgi:hypothetical protein